MNAVSARSASRRPGRRLLDDVAVAVGDPLDEEGLHAQALVGEGGVGPDHLHERRLAGAEGDRQVGGQLAGEAELARVLDALLDPDRLQRLHRGDVPALLHRAAERDRAQVRPVVVLRRPDRLVPGVREAERGVDEDRGRGPAERLEGGRVDDRLEGRAHLAHGLRRAVELALLEVVAADHRPHRARPHVEGEERPLDLRLLLEPDLRLLPAVGLGERDDAERGHHPARQHLGQVRAPRPGDVGGREPRAVVADLDDRGRSGRRRSRPPAPRRRRRRASPTRRGAAGSGSSPSDEQARLGLDEARARGGRARAARRAAPGRRPAACRGRASCRPAGRPGRCAGCRTPARGTCAPPRGSGARSRAGPCAGAARAAPAWPPPPPRGSRTSPRPCGRGRGCGGRAPARGARSGTGGAGSGRCRR